MTFPHLVIDYGHGGLIESEYQTPGKRYTHITDAGAVIVFEGVQNRIMAADVIRYALDNGRKVYDCVAGKWWTTPPKWHELEQRDVGLRTRVHNANSPSVRDGLLISMHSNATGDDHQGTGTTATGWEFYTSPGATRSDQAARSMAESARHHGEKVRGVLEASFSIVTDTRGVAVLVEHGFHTTRSDAERIRFCPGGIAAAYWSMLKGLVK